MVADYSDFLAAVSDVDLILTDPPYAISKRGNFAKTKLAKLGSYRTDFGAWDHEEIDLDALAQGCFQALRQGGTAIIFYDIWKMSYLHDALVAAGFVMPRLVEWVKSNPVPINSRSFYLANSREMAIAVVKGGKPTFHAVHHTGRYRHPIPQYGDERIHTTQKSDALFEALIRQHTNPGDLVADPFVGGGTTLVASEKLGRRCIAGDTDRDAIAKVQQRLLRPLALKLNV